MAESATTTQPDSLSAAERAAMKQRAAELRAEGKKGAKKADGLQAALDAIARMEPEDRALADRVHATITSTAPGLAPKTHSAQQLATPSYSASLSSICSSISSRNSP